MESKIKILATNRKAHYEYEITDKIECGIVLAGTEVKSMKCGHFSFQDAYIRIKNDELYLFGFHINTYTHGNIFNHKPDRERKLLAHGSEIIKLKRKVEEKGFTIIPLLVYVKNGWIKIEAGLCKGKKQYDKRESIKKRDLRREAERDLRVKY